MQEHLTLSVALVLSYQNRAVMSDSPMQDCAAAELRSCGPLSVALIRTLSMQQACCLPGDACSEFCQNCFGICSCVEAVSRWLNT